MIDKFRYVWWASIVATVVVSCVVIAVYNQIAPKREENENI